MEEGDVKLDFETGWSYYRASYNDYKAALGIVETALDRKNSKELRALGVIVKK